MVVCRVSEITGQVKSSQAWIVALFSPRLCIWGLDLALGRLDGMGRALAGTPSNVKSSGVKRPRHRQASAVVVGRCPTGAYRAAGPSALGPSPRRTARSLVEENPTCGAAITITGKVPGCLGMHALRVSTAAQLARVRPAHATNAMGLGCATSHFLTHRPRARSGEDR